MSKVQFYGISFVKVFSSFVHSVFCHVKKMYLNEFLRPVSLTSRILENAV